MKKEWDWLEVEEALLSHRFLESRGRLFRQLVEALLFEEIVQPETRTRDNGDTEYTIPGRDEAGHPVRYVCLGRRKLSFGRVRLSDQPIVRMVSGTTEEANDLALFMTELAPLLRVNASRLADFVRELERTLVNDVTALHWRDLEAIEEAELTQRGYEDLEGDVLEGHLYHPCYKSRVGFDPADNEACGPEFKPRLKLQWIAVRREDANISVSRFVDCDSFIVEQIGKDLYLRFVHCLTELGLEPEDFLMMPVHPWQWTQTAASHWYRQIRERRIVPLGEGQDEFSPQQSIRTLSNRTDPGKATVKLSLGILNTSSIRTLEFRHVRNGPIASDRLARIVEQDRYLRDELRPSLLKELIGISICGSVPSSLDWDRSFGSLGVIWRESVHSHLEADELAIPYTALCHTAIDGRPFIDPWVVAYGLERWLGALLRTTLEPLIHLLYAHGAAVESHAQNLALIHRAGMPVRLAMRDFSGGVLFYKEHGSRPDQFPETDQPYEVRDVFHNALFFINLAELALFLERRYGFDEGRFWRMTAQTIKGYHRRFHNLENRFDLFDLFASEAEIGKLAQRRLTREGGVSDRRTANPLHMDV